MYLNTDILTEQCTGNNFLTQEYTVNRVSQHNNMCKYVLSWEECIVNNNYEWKNVQ